MTTKPLDRSILREHINKLMVRRTLPLLGSSTGFSSSSKKRPDFGADRHSSDKHRD